MKSNEELLQGTDSCDNEALGLKVTGLVRVALHQETF
jgi:hypothetical protein